MVSGHINVSGINTTYQPELVSSPDGLFGASGAFLSAVNATFGFGSSPHTFSLSYAPRSFGHETLPTIGTAVDFSIDNFLVKGSVTHADYSKDSKGNLLNVVIQDDRVDLDSFFLDTVGLFGRNDTPSDDTVDVYNWYSKTSVSIATSGRSSQVKELESIKNNGATYRQIYDATEYYENTIGSVTGLLSSLPAPDVVESQLPGNVDGYRWKFEAEGFLSAMVRILSDVSYDCYWDMADAKLSVVNRKYSVTVTRDDIPYAGDTSETLHLKYGNDESDKPNKVRVFGPNMEGIVGSGRLIPTSGAFAASYDMGITVGAPSFEPGWRNVNIKYFGPDGNLATDIPTDAELSAALKSIEYWAHEKDLENRISSSGFVPASGSNVGQNSPTSYLSEMTSRYNSSKSWVVAWYNKVKTFADSHYGKTYTLKETDPLYGFIDDFEVVGEAWSNLENQASGLFEDGYQIDGTYSMLAPFYNAATNKLKAYCVMDTTTKWGITGEGVPTKFESWNEDELNQFVPIKVQMWKSSKTRFDSPAFEWDSSEKGIAITFPNFCFDPTTARNTALLTASSGITTANSGFLTGDWGDDFVDPLLNPVPYEEINPASGQSVALPVRVSRRYGYAYPSVWTSGTGSKLEVVVEDKFSPWNYEPRGTDTSVERLTADVNAFMSSQKIDATASTHAEVTKIGLPGVSFDDFSDQTLQSSGYGLISNGITSINVGRGSSDYWKTKYSVKAHFPQLVKAKPTFTRLDEDFSFVIKKIETRITDLELDLDIPEVFAPIDDTRITRIGVGTAEEKRSIPVTITTVYDRTSGDPYYLSTDSRGKSWPRNLDLNAGSQASQRARGADGLFDVNMSAVYHYERLEDGTFQHWYTGGVDLVNAKVMTVTSAIKTAGGSSVVDLQTLAPVGGVAIDITNVPLIDQANTDSVTSGAKVSVSSPMSDTNIRNYDFTPSAGLSELYVVNAAAGGGGSGTTNFVEVTTAPTSGAGVSGIVRTFAVGNISAITYDDSASGTKVSFVGIDPRIVASGDFGIISIQSDTEIQGSGSVAIDHVLCHIVKPTFINYGLI